MDRDAEIKLAAEIAKKLHTPLNASGNAERAKAFLKGGYNKHGYGVPEGAAIDGSFAIDKEGSQGYYVDGGKEIFLSTVSRMKEFFKNRERIIGKPVKYIIKVGIGGQHTPFQAIADAFSVITQGQGLVMGEYDLGKDYESEISKNLAEIDADWDQLAVIPSSKSGSTDETMVIFTDIFYAWIKKITEKEGLDGNLLADTVLDVLHKINFKNGEEAPAKDLFEGFSIRLVSDEINKISGMKIDYASVKKIFGKVLGNMFFETTDRPDQSRLSAFIRNSGLDKELEPHDIPGFGAMFDNVGGRWTGDLHMMTFLAYYDLDAEEYWNVRYEGIKKVRQGTHLGAKLGNKILDDGIQDIALIVPDELFWFGKAIEQNFNESIWQKGFANLIAIKEEMWSSQSRYYKNTEKKLIINIAGEGDMGHAHNLVNLKELNIPRLTAQKLANALGELFTTFYGMTNTVGNRLIARAVTERGYSAKDIDMSDLDSPAVKIIQENLFLRQPFVELGKGLLENKLKELHKKGSAEPDSLISALNEIKQKARAKSAETNIEKSTFSKDTRDDDHLVGILLKIIKFAEKENRKFVPFIYLDGDNFYALRDRLVSFGAEWVMQGTGDQHISYQQVLAQPKKYLPFIISFVPEQTLAGRQAIGFAKGYLNNISPHMIRDFFAEASYIALTEMRKTEGGKGLFLRMINSETNRNCLKNAISELFA
jgi:hypothetical protein